MTATPHARLRRTALALATGALIAVQAPGYAAPMQHGPDTRMALGLAPSERDAILREMRAFIEGIQKLTGAMAAEDWDAASKAAKSMGMTMMHEIPMSLRAKLPEEFRMLGSTLHGDFDRIALDAADLKSAKHTLGQLAAAMQKCVACHGSFRLQSEPAKTR